MSKILMIGDVHLKAKRLADVAGAWQWAVEWAKANGVDVLAQAGDVFDHYNVYGREASTGTIYAEFLKPLAANPIPMVAVVGNHDMGGPHDADALVPLESFADIRTYRKPMVVEVAPGLSICMLPWINKAHLLAKFVKKGMDAKSATERVSEGMGKLMAMLAKSVEEHKRKGNFVLFMGHLEVTGAKMAGGQIQSDGSFEYPPLELADLGCHAYALAHIHIRQHISGLPNPNDGYIGSLCQLNFGDAGNPAGFRVLEVDGQKIVSDQFVENVASPKYFTVSSIEDAKCRDTDYVKLRSETRPDVLPEGVIFEKIPIVKESKRRLEEKIDAEDSLEKLLKAWVDQQPEYSGPAVKDLVGAAEALLSGAPNPPVDAVGSLERIDRVTLRHIASHGSTDVDLSDVDGVCAIEGPTGVGKTTLVESIMLALYGGTPSKPTLPCWVTQKYVGDALIEVAFVSGGKKYLARRELRKTTKTFSHKAYLFDSATSTAIAGPKIEDVYSKCCELIGDPDMVWAGTFSSQDEVGNLTDVEPSERKKLFAKLLGTERLLFISDLAKKASNAEAAVCESNRSAINRLSEETASREQVEASITSLKERMAKNAGEVAKQEGAMEAARALMAKYAAQIEERARLDRRAKELAARKADIQSRGKTVKAQRDGIVPADMDGLGAALEAKKTERDDARAALQELEVKVEAARKPHEDEVRRLEVDYKLAQTYVADAKKKEALLKGFPDASVCQVCPLAKDGLLGRAEIPKLEDRANALARDLSAKMDRSAKIEAAADAAVANRALVRKMDDGVEAAANALSSAALRSRNAEVMDAQLAAMRVEFKQADEELKAIVIPEDPGDVGDKASMDRLQAELSRLAAENMSCSREIGRHEVVLEEMARKKGEIAELQAKMAGNGRAMATYDVIGRAFGRDGIPQYIVDGAIPRFEEVMAELLKEFRWSISISSQKQTKKGTVQEVRDIMIDDGDGDRELFTYSGGEKKILKGIVRLAFSTLQAERSGKGIKVLILDEATDAMDGEIAHVFVRMLSRASSAFKQVFIVSHKDHVLTSIPRRLILSPGADGTSVLKSI